MMKRFRPARLATVALAALAGAALPAAAQAAAPRHVILIMMENHGTDTLIGNKDDAPFINELVGQKGVTLATQYYGVTHPSLPNYLALVSGDYQGINDDCKAGADVTCKPEDFSPEAGEPPMKGRMMTDEQEKIAATTAHWFKTPTFLDQLEAAGHSWKVYMQGMAPDQKLAEYAPLDANGKVVAKLYAQKHNPFVYFAAFHDDAKRLEKILPYDGFLDDLKGDGLADFTWISPDQCHDMHGISEGGAAAIKNPDCAYPKSGLDHAVIKLGDAYLREAVGAIRAAPAWKDSAVVIVWDEDDYAGAAGIKGSPIGRNGAVLGGSRAPLIIVSPGEAEPRRLEIPYNHYNLLASLEAAYGVGCLARACDASDALIPPVQIGGNANPATLQAALPCSVATRATRWPSGSRMKLGLLRESWAPRSTARTVRVAAISLLRTRRRFSL
jgi:hypothetical protein